VEKLCKSVTRDYSGVTEGRDFSTLRKDMEVNGLTHYHNYDNSSGTDSRNFGTGRSDVVGTLIHTTAGTDSLDWLRIGAAKAGSPASADYLIDRNGDRHSIVSGGKYPYHAGKSSLVYNNHLYEGDKVSQLLLGVELENEDNTYCTPAQLDSLAELIVLEGLARGWRWPYYVLGHYEVARPLGRRSDPQGFLWGNFMGRLYIWALVNKVQGLV
jgi:N-acetyl-anhydromuramyl-L-alanine amidase AmpD